MPLPGQTIGEIATASADPAAGGEIVFVADQDMIVHSLSVTFITSAAAANRVVTMVADDGNAANVFFRTQSNFSHIASQNVNYAAFEGAPQNSTAYILIPLPTTGLRLRKNDRFLTATSGLQAGDDYGVMRLSVEHF